MAETNDTMKDWDALQRQYWNAWSDMSRPATTGGAPLTMPWQEGLEQWSRLFGSPQDQQSEIVEKLTSGAKTYLAMMQSVLGNSFAQGPDFMAGNGGVGQWSDALRNAFNMPGMDSALTNNPMAKAMRESIGQSSKGFEQIMGSLGPMIAAGREEAMAAINTPAFGLQREKQEHKQKSLRAWVAYQEANQRYNALILKSSQRSFSILEDKLVERSEPGRQMDSVRAFYDLWVDSAEEAYAEIAMTDEFRKVYGEVVDAQSRVRSQLQQDVERIGVDLGMPTRSELNSVHKLLHELRRDLRRREEADGADLAKQIAELRSEVVALKKQVDANAQTEGERNNTAVAGTSHAAVKTSKPNKR
jgi:polyhydroxyalkanoate synthase subunit PhaE